MKLSTSLRDTINEEISETIRIWLPEIDLAWQKLYFVNALHTLATRHLTSTTGIIAPARLNLVIRGVEVIATIRMDLHPLAIDRERLKWLSDVEKGYCANFQIELVPKKGNE